MRHKIIKTQQLIFGIILLLLGLNGLFHIIPLPEKVGFAKEFMDMLEQVLYLMPVVACIQILTGLSLITKIYTNLGLLILLPITFNIFAFHLLHDRDALVPAIALFGLNVLHLVLRADVSNQELHIRSKYEY